MHIRPELEVECRVQSAKFQAGECGHSLLEPPLGAGNPTVHNHVQSLRMHAGQQTSRGLFEATGNLMPNRLGANLGQLNYDRCCVPISEATSPLSEWGSGCPFGELRNERQVIRYRPRTRLPLLYQGRCSLVLALVDGRASAGVKISVHLGT